MVVHKGVDGHPLEGSSGRQYLAVVESSSRVDSVVARSSHHSRLDGHSVVGEVKGVSHEGPDP